MSFAIIHDATRVFFAFTRDADYIPPAGSSKIEVDEQALIATRIEGTRYYTLSADLTTFIPATREERRLSKIDGELLAEIRQEKKLDRDLKLEEARLDMVDIIGTIDTATAAQVRDAIKKMAQALRKLIVAEINEREND